MRFSLFWIPLLALTSAVPLCSADQPNLLWLTSEDHGPQMGCYGDHYATTPHIDGLAAKGMLFKKCWSNGPVCAAARTTIISGLYPPSTGGEHMRSMVQMPKGMKMYPEFLRSAGYYCTNNSKEDYNLTKLKDSWDESSKKAHWKNRRDGQPFFAIFNETCSHESQIRTRPHKQVHDPKRARVPAYHPDTPEVRQDWAQYYDKVTEADASAGQRLKELEEAGLAEETIVFYYADHGSGMPRSKRWPSNSGLHVPMVVYFPAKWRHLAPKEYGPGIQSDRLISFVDLAPTLLSIIGIQPPAWMQGHAFAGKFQTESQPYLYGFRGRMDERYDCVRSVTDGRFVYVRNFMPHLSQAQHVAYQMQTPTTKVWKKLFDEGKTTPEQSLFWQQPKPAEELYDLSTDPDEVHNLADVPEHAERLLKMRRAQEKLALDIRDVGLLPEGEIHQRSEGTSPYEMGHDDALYPMQKVVTLAGVASSLKMDQLELLRAGFAESDSALRYWAIMGVLMRREVGLKLMHEEVQQATHDSSTYVQIAAHWTLAKYGTVSEQKDSLKSLIILSDGSRHNVFTAMSALCALGDLGNGVKPWVEDLKKLPKKGHAPDPRYDSYVSRLLSDLTGSEAEFEADATPAPKKTNHPIRKKR
jgi:uncharacterized sulfatase